MTSSRTDVANREAGDAPTESDRPLPPPKGSTKLRRRPLELDAGRLARPVRRALVGRQRPVSIRDKIQHSTRCKQFVPHQDRSGATGKNLGRAPLREGGAPGIGAVTNRSGCVGEGPQIPPGGTGPRLRSRFAQPGWRGELSTWRQADRASCRRSARGERKIPRAKSSTMISARKGLPVSLCGDGARPRTLLPRGYPRACPFCSGKSRRVRRGNYDGPVARA